MNTTGTSGDKGDGGRATDAEFFSPGGLALGRDGTLYIADFTFDRIRRVGADGVITAVAGRRHPDENPNTTFPIEGDDGPAAAATFNQPISLAVAPDGALYIADQNNGRIRKMTPPLPGLSAAGDTVIASADGSELYVFNPRGRHQRTVDALVKDDQGDPRRPLGIRLRRSRDGVSHRRHRPRRQPHHLRARGRRRSGHHRALRPGDHHHS